MKHKYPPKPFWFILCDKKNIPNLSIIVNDLKPCSCQRFFVVQKSTKKVKKRKKLPQKKRWRQKCSKFHKKNLKKIKKNSEKLLTKAKWCGNICRLSVETAWEAWKENRQTSKKKNTSQFQIFCQRLNKSTVKEKETD